MKSPNLLSLLHRQAVNLPLLQNARTTVSRIARGRAALAVLAALLTLCAAPAAKAAVLTWDAGNTNNGVTIDPLSGDWNTNADNFVWNDGVANVIWSQTSTTNPLNDAIFAGADGTLNQYVVTLATQMSTSNLTFNSSGYQITGSTVAVIRTAALNGAITVAAGKTNTISSQIVYNNNQVVSNSVGAGGILNLGGGAGNSQYRFAGGGTVNMTAGTYSANVGFVNNPTFNHTNGTFNITPGNGTGYEIGGTAGQSVNYTLSGTGTLTVNGNNTTNTVNGSFLTLGRNAGNTNYANTLTVQSGATVNIGTTASRAGELRIAFDAISNGKLDVQGGTVTIGTGSVSNRIYFFKAGANAGYAATMTQSGGTVTANGIQFGGTSGTYDGTSAASLTLSSGTNYIGAQGITRGSSAAALPVSIRLQGGTLGGSAAWASSLPMSLGTNGGGLTIRCANANSNDVTITLLGNLSNDGAVNGTLTKTFNGGLILSGNNTYSGGTTINGGRYFIQGSGGTALPATGPVQVNAGTLVLQSSGSPAFNQSITLADGARLSLRQAATINNVTLPTAGSVIFNRDDQVTQPFTLGNSVALTNDLTVQVGGQNTNVGAVTLGGVISGNFGLTKTEVGTLILAGNKAYSGSTTISNGTLVGMVGGSCSNSAVTVVDAAGCTLGISITDNTKQWTCAGLTFAGANAGLEFDFGYVAPSASVSPLQVNGNVDFTGTPLVTIKAGAIPAGTGSYPLMTWTGIASGTAPTTATLPPHITGGLSVIGSTLYLDVTGNTQPMTWNVGTGDWDINTTANWKDSTGTPGQFYLETTLPGDNVIFDDTPGAGTYTVTLNSTVTPASMTVNNTNVAYTISGTGKIAGGTGLAKSGAGALTVSTANSYSGTTAISEGTLKLGAANVIPDGGGNGNVAVTGTLDLNTFSETINGLSGAGTVDTVTGGTPTLTVGNNNQTSTFAGQITNTTGTLALTKTGTGTLTLSGANAYSGATTISGGTLKLGAPGVIPDGPGNVAVTGTLDLNGFSETINGLSGVGTVNNTAASTSATLTVGGGGTFSGTIANSGSGATLALVKSASGADFILSGTNTYSGGTTLNGGPGRVFIEGSGGTPLPSTGTVLVNSNATLNLNANGSPAFNQSITLADGAKLALRKAATLSNVTLPTSGTVTFNSDDSTTLAFSLGSNVGLTGDLTVQVGGNNTNVGAVTLGGVIGGGFGLTKTASGKLILAGTNTYSGNTTVSNGTLAIQVASLAPSSTVSVETNAVLQLDFPGTNAVTGFVTNGVSLAAGIYSSNNVAPFIAGPGSLQVGPVGPVEPPPANLTNSVTGGTNLALSWPAGQGWRLQQQTNALSKGLSTNWVFITDSSINSTNITVDKTKPATFYRLFWP